MRIRSRLFLAITPRSISLLRKVLNKSVGSIWSHEWRWRLTVLSFIAKPVVFDLVVMLQIIIFELAAILLMTSNLSKDAGSRIVGFVLAAGFFVWGIIHGAFMPSLPGLLQVP